MKLSAYKEDYYWYSGKASDVARKIAFAGIALIWVFKMDADPVPRIPADLLLPAALLAIALGLDLLHYMAGAGIWWGFHWWHERKLKDPSAEDPELAHGYGLVAPLHTLFVVKLACVVAAYYRLASYAWRTWMAG